MFVQGLGYVGVSSGSLPDWADFGTNMLGMQLVDKAASGLAFRMDDRRQRLLVEPGADGARFYGWEVPDADALRALAARLSDAGIDVRPLDAATIAQRHVTDGVRLLDPAGNLLELFHGPEIASQPFVPGRNISGFRTGPLGMGHVVLMTERLDEILPFYMDLLGFRVSDYMNKPFKALFMHTNARHHSLAFVEMGKSGQMHHMMVELFNLDDVGQGYDLANREDGRVSTSLGRHSNDLMTSFYANTPSKFLVEYGWGGMVIEPETWEPFEMQDGPSLWGHDRAWMSVEAREASREMRIAAAARGARAPVHVAEGNHTLAPGTCAWWDMASRG